MANKQIRYGIGFDVDKSGLQQIRSELQSLSNLHFKDLKIINPDATKEDFERIKASANDLSQSLEKSFNPKLGTINISKFEQELKNTGNNISKIEQDFAKMGSQGVTSFRNLTSEILTTQREIKKSSSFLDSMGKTLMNTIKWSIASSAINGITGAIRQAWNYSVKLDTSLNDIRIVTGKSAEDMDKFAKKANRAAQALGTATTAYSKASLIYYQQGLSEKDVQARTDVTIKAANVTGQSAAEVSEQLTAVWNGYKVVASEAELYVDKLSAVAATTAADLEELSEGMSKVASGANAMGVNIDQLTAQLSTIVSVTRQDASSVGTALKTIFARMGDLKVDGVDEFGVSLGDVSGTLKKVGIEVLDQEGNLRDMGTVMEEVAGKWGTWTEAQQQAIAVAMAGKRQYNNLLALFENWDMYESALSTSQGAEGTLQKQQDTYMESTQAHLDQLRASGERVFDAFFNNKSMNDLIDAITTAVNGFGNFVEAIGGGGNLLLGLGSIATSVFSDKIAGGISRALHNFGLLKEYQRQYQAELEIAAQYEGASDEAVKKMVSLKEKELKYSKWLTEEQKKQFEYYIKETNELYNQKDAFEDKVKAAEEYYREITEDDRELGLGKGSSNQYMVSDKDVATKLRNQADKIEDLNTLHVQGYSLEIGNGDASAGDTGSIERESAGIIAKNSKLDLVDKSTDELEKIKQNTALTDEQSNAIERLIQNKQELSNRARDLESDLDALYEVGAINVKEYDNLANQIDKAANSGKGLATIENKLKSILKNKPKEIRKQADEIENLSKEQDDLNRKIKDSENAQEGFLKSINTQALIGGITKAIGALGQLASAWSMIKNLGSIWSDESISDGEKILQTFMNLLPVLGMLGYGFKGLSSAIMSVTTATDLQNTSFGKNLILLGFKKSLQKANTEEEKRAILSKALLAAGVKKENLETEINNVLKGKQVLVNGKVVASNGAVATSTWAIVWPLLIIVAVIGTIIALIAIISNAIAASADDGAKALQQAGKGAESLKEELNRVKDANEELKKSFDEYDKAQEAIENMTKGTEEWKEAIQSANLQVLDLLDKYPELAQYISDVDGQLKISEEGREKMLEQSQKEVALATRNSLLGNVNVLNKKNSQIAQQGSTKTLSDVYVRNGSYSYGGQSYPTYGRVREADRDFAYQKAIEVVNKNGNSILTESYENFEKAMKEAGVTEEALIKTLYENSEELAKSASAVAANTAAINLQNKQIANSYLEESSDAYKNAEQSDKDAIAAIFANQSNTETQAYKDALKKYGQGDTDINHKDASAYADEYAEMMGFDYAKKEVKDGFVTYYDAAGKEVSKIEYNAMGQALAQRDAQEAAKGSVEDIQVAVDKAQSVSNKLTKSTSQENLKKAMSALVAGATSADLGGLSQQDLLTSGLAAISSSDLSSASTTLGFDSVAELETQAKTLGYESAEAYVKAIETSVANYNYEKGRLNVGLSSFAKAAFAELGTAAQGETKSFLDDFSLKTQEGIADSLQNAFETSGETGVTALKQLYKDIGDSVSEEELQAISKIAEDIDWSSSSAIADFKYELSQLGIDPSTINNFDKFTDTMAKVVNVVQDVMTNINGLQTKLQAFGELTNDLSIGNIISKEDYDQLIRYNAELAKFFVLTADGYKYIGGAEGVFKETQKGILDPEKVKEQFTNAEKEAENVGFDSELSSTSDRAKELNKLFANGKADNLLSASGINKDVFTENYNVLQGNATTTVGRTTLSVSELAKMSAGALGIVAGVEKEVAQKAIDDAKERLKTAEDYINSSYTALDTSLNSIEDEDGAWSKNMNTAITMAVSGLAKNYEELKGYSNIMDQAEYAKLANLYLAEEAQQLGITASAWEAYTKSVEGNLDSQEKMLSNIYTKKLYDEVDMYSDLTDAIDGTTKAIEELEKEKGRASGKDYLDSLNSEIEMQKELIELENSRQDAKEADRGEYALRQSVLSGIQGSRLADFGVSLSFGENGLATDDTLGSITKLLMKGTLSNEEYQEIFQIYQDIVGYNDKIEEDRLESEEKVAAARESILNAQIEGFDKAIEIRLNLEDAKQQWLEFRENYINKSGLEIFEDNKFINDLKNLQDKTSNVVSNFGTAYLNALGLASMINEDGSLNLSGTSFEYDGVQNEAAFMESFGSSIDTVLEKFDGLVELTQGYIDSYSKAQEEIVELYDKQINKLSTINGLQRGSAELAKLLGKNVSGYYAEIRENATQQYELNSQKLATLEGELAKAFDKNGNQLITDEQLESLRSSYEETAQAVLDSAKEMADALAEEFSENFKESLSEALGGTSWTALTTSWDLAQKEDSAYLDEVNKTYSISKLERQYQESIDKTDSLSAQKKLNSAMEAQLKLLREKDKLSQNDIDRANAMYELTLKQIALEESQRTASKMQLVRDSSGNYTYQYVQDEDAVSKAQAEVQDAENKLYNTTKEGAKELVNEVISLGNDFSEAYANATTDDERQRVKDTYSRLFSAKQEDFIAIQETLTALGVALPNSIAELFTQFAAGDYASIIGSSSITDYDNALNLNDEKSIGSKVNAAIGVGEKVANNITIDDVSATVKDITDKTGGLAATISQMTGLVDSVADKVNSLLATYNTALEKDASINQNTSALIDNTEAIRYLSYLMDSETGNDKEATDWFASFMTQAGGNEE